jgi:hypothetical protein
MMNVLNIRWQPDGMSYCARSGDPFAVQRLPGHANLKTATRYVQDVSKRSESQFAVRVN